MDKKKRLFLLDGHALVYRAHYAFIARPLINSKGLNTSAITGFVRTLWDLLRNEKPSHIGIAFDPHGKVFRHEKFPEYKANRDAQPEDITKAFPFIHRIVEGFKIPIIMKDNYEADDAIGTVAKKAEKSGFQVYMVTPDKDYAQLVSDNVFMYKPSRKGNGVDILGRKEVLEKWDIQNVDQVIDVLALQGDSVDNIPGIPGIGAKTAVKLLKQFHSLEGILENTESLKGKQKEKVIEFAEQGRLSKWLATIDIDAPFDFEEESFLLDPMDKDALAELFEELEFRTLSRQILGEPQMVQGDLFAPLDAGKKQFVKEKPKTFGSKKDLSKVEHKYELVDKMPMMEELARNLSKYKILTFDTETTNIDANIAELVGLSFAVNKGVAYYIPVPEDYDKATQICSIFKKLLEDEDIIKIGQNIKYDNLILKWYGIEVKGLFFDTMIAHYLCEPDLRHKLDYLSESYLDYKMIPITDLIGRRGKNQLTMRDVPVEKVVDYACEDADITLQIKTILESKLEDISVKEFYYKVEEPLIDVLCEMEYTGVHLDAPFLNRYSKVLGESIISLEREVYQKAGVNFNISSPKQVGEVLFDRMKLPYRWRKTATGAYSTDVDKLNELSVDHDIVKTILQYRKLTKLKSTYVDSLPLMVNPKTGRIHTNYNQARAATGRLSSENPNLQNIPIKNDEGREIRKAFIPRNEDHILLAADYSQIELRLITEMSKDPSMMQAFKDGNDFHRATAAKVYNVPYEEVTAEQRRNAKTVNFSIIYGAGATNLSNQLGIKRSEAKELIQTYFQQFSGLRQYMDETVKFAREHEYVQTMLGRKRFIRDINSRNNLAKSNAERMAINTPIQGTAADMIKIAMIKIHKEFRVQKFQSKMIMQVHDELVFDVYRPELETIQTLVEREMKEAIPNLEVPIVVGMGTGDNWLQAH